MSPGVDPKTSRAPWLARVGVDLRAGEGAVFALLVALYFLLLAFQYVGKAVRQSAFIDGLGAERLPLAYLLVAVAVYPVLRAWERVARGKRLDHLLVAAAAVVALCLLGFAAWFHAAPGSPWPSFAFYLWTAVAGILLVSLFWSYAAERLDPRQARRLFGAIGAAGILGSVAGGQAARWGSGFDLAAEDSVAGALVLGALLLGLASALLLFAAGEGRFGNDRRPEADADLSAALDGAALVRRSPYLRLVAAGVLLSALVAQVIDLQFAWVIEESTDTLEERTAAFGNLYSVMGLAAFVFQLAVTSRLHRRLGVGFSLGVLPATTGVGSILLLAAAAFAPALLLPVAWALKLAENGLRYSLDQASRELLFQPVPEAQRPRAKLFVDVVAQRAAKGLAAVALLTVTLGWLEVVHTAWLTLVAVVAWLAVIGATHRHYVASFRDGLLLHAAGRGEASSEMVIDPGDADTLEILVAGLGSSDPREICHSLSLLERNDRGHLVPPVLLAHDDREVRLATLDVLRRRRRADAAPWIERLLGDEDPSVRAAAIRTLAAVTSDDLCQAMEERLYDADPRVRSVAVAYLAARADPELRTRADSSLSAMLEDPDSAVRCSAAQALAEMPEPHHQAGLVHLLYDSNVSVARAAIEAVERRCESGGASPLYLPILVSHLQRRRLKHEARTTLVAYGEQAIPALQHFLFDSNEPIWVRRALPKTLARIGGPRALEVLLDALSARDLFQRRKIVEALGTLCHQDGPTPDRSLIEAQIGVECRDRLRVLLDLWSVEAAVRTPGRSLLERLLADRVRAHAENVFGLLELIHEPREIRAARRGMERRPHVRAHALEFLDNVLQGEVRQQVFAALDDLPRDDRRRRARRFFGLESSPAAEVLERLATERLPGDADAPWITAAALWLVAEERLETLYPLLRRVAERDEDPLVQETSAVIASRLGSAA